MREMFVSRDEHETQRDDGRMPDSDECDVLPVYLVHWNAPQWCRSAARSILRTRELRIALTVVDNGQDGDEALRGVLPPSVRILESGANLGYTGGANLAIADWRVHHPDAAFCVIGSHDLHVVPDTFAELVRAARRHPEHGVIAPSVLGQYACGGMWDGRDVRPAREDELPVDDGVLRPDWAPGVCLLLRRGCIDDVRGFDEWFGSYVEDLDLCLRARDAGWQVGVVPAARAWSLGSISPSSLQLIEANLIRFHRKRGGRLAGLRAAATVTRRLGVCIAGSAMFWRNPERRAVSRSYARRRARSLRVALPSLLTAGRDHVPDGAVVGPRR